MSKRVRSIQGMPRDNDDTFANLLADLDLDAPSAYIWCAERSPINTRVCPASMTPSTNGLEHITVSVPWHPTSTPLVTLRSDS
jgi:hypothetical protein